MGMRESLNGSDWQFKGYLGEDWVWRNGEKPDTRDVRWWYQGTVPGTVQNDLWNQGLVPDPYFEQNSLLLEWVPQRTWIYRKVFRVNPAMQGKRVRLHFKGVDYEAQFFLNGHRLGEHVGMYTPAVFDVTESLDYAGENLLAVVIEPAPPEQPQVSKTRRVTTHKARMTYWWDFCPRMPHVGIWDEVYLEATGPVRVDDLFARPQLGHDLAVADVTLGVDLFAEAEQWVDVQAAIRFDGQEVAVRRVRQLARPGRTHLDLSLSVAEPRLWWPNGFGEQPLYEAEVRVVPVAASESGAAGQQPGPAGLAAAGALLETPENISDSRSVAFGIRRVEFVPNEKSDPSAMAYTFRVNGRRLYAKGWNWVPMDVMYGVERPEKLERLLTLARRANVNLLRVWGGGLIEKDAFYDLCDRYGIMVWQEFIQSSSGIENKPSTDPAFLDMMVQEAEQIVPRKRNHPSLVIWCGGNELMGADGRPLDDSEPVLAALHGVVARLDPDRYWLPTSPTGPASNNDLKAIEKNPLDLHDVHGPWEHQGLTEQYTLYNRGSALFHSEFGAEGMANRKTLNATIRAENQWPATRDNPVYFHLGSWWVNEPLIQKAFGGIEEIGALQKASQFLQYEALRYALEADRRRAYQCSGTIPWQFNEPYPNGYCTAAVDYYGIPKPAYYAVAGVYEAIRPTARFETQAWAGRTDFAAELIICNSTHRSYPGAVLQVRITGAGGKVYLERSITLTIKADGPTPVERVALPLSEVGEDLFFLDLKLAFAGQGSPEGNRYLFTRGETLAPMLTAPATTLKVERQNGRTVRVTNTGSYTALQVGLEDARDVHAQGYAYFSANHFMLLPGESRDVTVEWSGVLAADQRLQIGGWNTEVSSLV